MSAITKGETSKQTKPRFENRPVRSTDLIQWNLYFWKLTQTSRECNVNQLLNCTFNNISVIPTKTSANQNWLSICVLRTQFLNLDYFHTYVCMYAYVHYFIAHSYLVRCVGGVAVLFPIYLPPKRTQCNINANMADGGITNSLRGSISDIRILMHDLTVMRM